MYFEFWDNTQFIGRPDWRWHLKGGNGEIVAYGEGYVNKGNCLRAVSRLRQAIAKAPIRPITRV